MPSIQDQETQAVTDWDRMVREHGPMVFGTAWRILGHVADTEDIVQEVFLEAHRYQQTRAVNCWAGLLRRLASCRALDRLRQRKNLLSLGDYQPIDGTDGPEANAMEAELAERLRHAVARLPEREGAVFCLRYFESLSNQQIAETLNISPGAVGVALHKARAKLEEQLTGVVRGGTP